MNTYNYDYEKFVSDQELAGAKEMLGGLFPVEKITKEFICLYAQSAAWTPFHKEMKPLDDGSFEKVFIETEERAVTRALQGLAGHITGQVRDQFKKNRNAQADEEISKLLQ